MPVFVGAGTSSFLKGDDGVGISTMTTTERNALSGVKKGQFIFNETINLAQYWDGSSWKSIDSPPAITNFTIDGGSAVTSAKVDNTAAGNATIVINGSNFDTTSGTVIFEPESGGSNVTVQSITRNSTSQFTVTVQRSDFVEANDPYAIKLTNGSGLAATLASAIDVNVPPIFVNALNDILASIVNGGSALSGSTADASATDPDGDTITYSITSGALPSGLTLGSSDGYITGSVSGVTAQTYTFTVRASTSHGFSERQFRVVVANTPAGGNITDTGGYRYHAFTSSGTFQVYTGFTPNIEIFMIGAGGGGGSWVPGGGGAGGAVNIDSPASFSTSAQTYTVTVGGGGSGAVNPGSMSAPFGGQSLTGGDTSLRDASGNYLLTAIGGGRGGNYDGSGSPNFGRGQDGGCGGGQGRAGQGNGSGVQTTATTSPLGNAVSANSRTYGIGNAGGSGSTNEPYGQHGGGGLNNSERSSGSGKNGIDISWVNALNIGTNSGNSASSGGYFGGGGGAGHHSGGSVGSGGVGGGATGRSNSGSKAPSGYNNTGGGGGGGGRPGGSYSEGGNGGSGVVILRYTLS